MIDTILFYYIVHYSLGVPVNKATMEASRESEVLWWVIFSKISTPGGCTGSYQIINKTYHNTLDSLEASMVAPFTGIPKEESKLV